MKALAVPCVVTLLLTACGAEHPPSATPASQAVAPPAPSLDASPAPVTPPVEAPPPARRTASPARLPVFNATCGNGTEVHANEGGPVFLDGQEASLKKFSDDYFEASRGSVTVSISFRPDDSLSLSFSGSGRTNGICTLK